MFRVVSLFADLTDGKHLYKPGDEFPRQGLTVTAGRIKELASCDNAVGHPVIEAVEGVNKAEDKSSDKSTADTQKPAQKPRRGRQKG